MIQRVRYDFELIKAELLRERFFNSFINWCKENNVQSRAQAYGRGYFPLEGSFDVDIPECETWIRPGLGDEMNEQDYRIGQGLHCGQQICFVSCAFERETAYQL